MTASLNAPLNTPARRPRKQAPSSRLTRLALTVAVVACLLLFLILPLSLVFLEALSKGWQAYGAALQDSDAIAAIGLTLLTAAIVVPINTILGVAAAWAITRHRFRGRTVLVALIDLPLSVSPVVVGLAYVLVYGAQGWIGPWLMNHNIKIIFALPGMIMVMAFVTLPYVARELIGVMQAQGQDAEEAALTLGATGWQTLWKVTLPAVRGPLLQGVILCNARAMGEYGAVSVVSGHIRGLTNTIPLQMQILYDQYEIQAAFALASVLALLALLTLGLRVWLRQPGASAPRARVKRRLGGISGLAP